MKKKFTLIEAAQVTGLSTGEIADWAEEHDVPVKAGNLVFGEADIEALCALAEEDEDDPEDQDDDDDDDESDPEDADDPDEDGDDDDAEDED